MVGGIVPFAEGRSTVGVLPQNLCDGGAFPRPRSVISREAGCELRDAARVNRVMVASRQKRGPRWRAERRRMERIVAKTLARELLQGRRIHRSAECACLSKSDIVEQ